MRRRTDRDGGAHLLAPLYVICTRLCSMRHTVLLSPCTPYTVPRTFSTCTYAPNSALTPALRTLRALGLPHHLASAPSVSK